LVLGADKADAETMLRRCDGNLRRVFAEIAKENRREAAAPREHGGAIKP